MIASVRKWILHALLRRVYIGITTDDFIDVEKMTKDELHEYVSAASDIARSDVFVSELARLRFVQERRMLRDAKNENDLLFGKAVLFALTLIETRFAKLCSIKERTSELVEDEEEASSPAVSY